LTDSPYRLLALSIAAVVCIAASNGGTTSQDLKTGYLVGATPKWQQWSILVGSISSALVIGIVLIMLNSSSTIYSKSPKNLPTLSKPLDMAQLKSTALREQAPGDEKLYYVWHPVEGNEEGAAPGKYLVDEQGKVCYLVDPGISGRLTRRDDGTEVRKFSPPQAELFALITKGILSQKLPWVLVLMGVALALVLELCGVSSLPFAVGVYLPLSSSAPIFVGGMLRYVVERFGSKSGEKPKSELESEMSPGVLFSTGYIAGGTIAGVLVSCMYFSDTLPEALGLWQYRKAPVEVQAPFDEQCRALAKNELGEGASEKALQQNVDEIKEINATLLTDFVPLSKGTKIELSKDRNETVKADTTLGEFAKQTEDKPTTIYELNSEKLPMPSGLPVGIEMRLPQRNSPAVLAFAALSAILIAVGFGWILKTKGDSP
jgi:hypothetical protein